MSPNTVGRPPPASITEPLVPDRSEQSMSNVSPAMIAAKSTATPASQREDLEPQGVSRTDAWLGRATLFLKVTKDVTEVTGVLATLKAACGVAVTLLEAVQAVECNRKAWNELLSSIRRDQKAFVLDLDRNDIEVDALEADHPLGAMIKDYQTSITGVLASIFREAGITDAEIKENKTTVKRLAKRIGTTTLEANVIIDYRLHLTEAKDAIMRSLQVYVVKLAQDMQETVLLKELQISGLEHGSHIEGCMENTRQNVINQLQEWTEDMDASNIFWIKGHPGVGKSAIATSLVKQLRASRRLGSHFFFQRQRAAEMSPDALWRTVAYELAQAYPTVQRHLVAKLKAKEIHLATVTIADLFHNLIHESLMASQNIPAETSPVIVIDALDECGGLDGQHSEHRRALMKTLSRWSELPSKFKLIVTSRSENDIERLFSTIPRCLLEIPTGSMVDEQSSEDIQTFLTHRLHEVAVQYQDSLPSDWPGAQTFNQLTLQAAGLFIWADIVVKFIMIGQADRRLQQVLEGGGTGNMDALYKQILSLSFRELGEGDSNDFRSFVGTIILAKAPLSSSSLTQFLSIDKCTVQYICNGLQSVLDSKSILQFHHQSFVDFLLDQSKCPQTFAVNRKLENRKLTLACLRVVKKNLRFNICGLASSHTLNVDVPDLLERSRQHIPPHLSYSCSWWASHLAETEFDEEIFRDIHCFMQTQFLFWLEVLSIIKRVNQGSRALLLLGSWILSHGQDDAVAMARDMQKFVAAFASVISQSVPHIYLSALPFSPRNSAVSKQYRDNYSKTLSIQRGGLHDWPAFLNVLYGHTEPVASVGISPDGHRIISGSRDKTIRVWDAETGETVAGPLTGHTGRVNSVAFSPCGHRLVSGASDETIRVWNAETGELVVGPLKRHTAEVYSAAFSPDGHRVVSGSLDETILVWDTETGETVVGPLKGHTSGVVSVAFSPDGHRIVSGSQDNTIRVWNAETGELVAGPLEGHTGGVNSVSFSPDGHRLVSGSSDETIRVWNAETGELVKEPLKGHTDRVTSVAFLPDGHRIVSGSWDKTIRVWDAETGEVVMGPLKGHTGSVDSVAFSLGGYRIVSGAGDMTIRVWDAEMGEVMEPLKGHANSVFSIAFSPDGRHIVSGSRDTTVVVWDAETGEVVKGPLTGHTAAVYSVAFSPNGRRIVSGANDKTIRVWDAETGETVAGPLTGHTDWVNSVAFSPGGHRIVSGSWDKTIRVWDAETGEVMKGPLKGHTDWVNSVAFSPDGHRIVSGSRDMTIRVWDAETGQTVVGPLKRHTGSVSSASFSPDGCRIVSGSRDKTIRVWDAETGQMVAGPLKGHTDAVNSVAFSPDGHRIVSGSTDRTIPVWDAESGEVVKGPLRGHTGRVYAVVFSPDGRRIISSSSDEMIRVQDAIISGSKAFSTISASFTGSSAMNDGWILGSDSERLFWVPPTLRTGLMRPGNVLCIGGHIATRLDLNSFVHGESWSLCKTSHEL